MAKALRRVRAMLLEIITEETSVESIFYWLFVVGAAGMGLIGAVCIWMLFNRMKHRRAPR
jgi:hypothetical protein